MQKASLNYFLMSLTVTLENTETESKLLFFLYRTHIPIWEVYLWVFFSTIWNLFTSNLPKYIQNLILFYSLLLSNKHFCNLKLNLVSLQSTLCEMTRVPQNMSHSYIYLSLMQCLLWLQSWAREPKFPTVRTLGDSEQSLAAFPIYMKHGFIEQGWMSSCKILNHKETTLTRFTEHNCSFHKCMKEYEDQDRERGNQYFTMLETTVLSLICWSLISSFSIQHHGMVPSLADWENFIDI